MLRNLDPILCPDLLYVLRAMGHGDEIALVDANFPGASTGPRCVRADGSDNSAMLRAVLAVMPLDTFVEDPALCMEMVGPPPNTPRIVADFQAILDSEADAPRPIKLLERFAFYDRAAACFAIVQTGERRLYGNIILKKGVIG